MVLVGDSVGLAVRGRPLDCPTMSSSAETTAIPEGLLRPSAVLHPSAILHLAHSHEVQVEATVDRWAKGRRLLVLDSSRERVANHFDAVAQCRERRCSQIHAAIAGARRALEEIDDVVEPAGRPRDYAGVAHRVRDVKDVLQRELQMLASLRGEGLPQTFGDVFDVLESHADLVHAIDGPTLAGLEQRDSEAAEPGGLALAVADLSCCTDLGHSVDVHDLEKRFAGDTEYEIQVWHVDRDPSDLAPELRVRDSNWTAAAAGHLAMVLRSSYPSQWSVLLAAAENGGQIGRDEAAHHAGLEAGQTFRGFARPATRTHQSLIRSGLLSRDSEPPLIAVYDQSPQATSFRVPDCLGKLLLEL